MSDPDPENLARAKEMRALRFDDRMDAIEASPNVIGYDVFAERTKQVALAVTYRAPAKPAPGGKA